MFLENVKHILKVSNGEVIKYIKQKLDKIGYHLQDLAKFQISPHNYGIPQQRERVYFVCIRKDIYETHYISNEIMLPPPIPKEKIQFEKFLDEKENIDLRYLIKNNKDILQALEVWDEMIKKFDVGEKISPTIMINDYYKMKDGTYTQEDIMNFASWRTDYTNKNKPLIEKYESDFNEWYPKYSDILQKREIYGKLEWQTGHIKENDSIFNHCFFNKIMDNNSAIIVLFLCYQKYLEDASTLVVPLALPLNHDRQYKQLELKPWF